MVEVVSGVNWKGEVCKYPLHGLLKQNLDEIKKVVLNKDFDYVALVCGLPGLGKSNFAINVARYCCEWFDESYICFTAKEFINKTDECPRHSAIILDESFASLNSKISLTSDFLKITNHLQIIRQKNLFTFLCLPNFFDLAKGVAIYRSSHLFVCYGEKFGDRGDFAAFDREKKKDLYINGMKFMNYHCVKPNFRGNFTKQQVIDDDAYRENKLRHLKEKEPAEKKNKWMIQNRKLIAYAYHIVGMKQDLIADIIGLSQQAISQAAEDYKNETLLKFGKEED